MNLLKIIFMDHIKTFFLGLIDGRGWMTILLGAGLFLIVQTVSRLEVLVSTLGLIFICAGVAIMVRKMLFKHFDLHTSIKKASDERCIASALHNVAVIILMCIVMYITAIFLNS